jgi:hypothetical protein
MSFILFAHLLFNSRILLGFEAISRPYLLKLRNILIAAAAEIFIAAAAAAVLRRIKKFAAAAEKIIAAAAARRGVKLPSP